MQTTSGDSDSGVPWLSHLPVLGYAFKQKQQSGVKSELVILLRPVVSDDQSQIDAMNESLVAHEVVEDAAGSARCGADEVTEMNGVARCRHSCRFPSATAVRRGCRCFLRCGRSRCCCCTTFASMQRRSTMPPHNRGPRLVDDAGGGAAIDYRADVGRAGAAQRRDQWSMERCQQWRRAGEGSKVSRQLRQCTTTASPTPVAKPRRCGTRRAQRRSRRGRSEKSEHDIAAQSAYRAADRQRVISAAR